MKSVAPLFSRIKSESEASLQFQILSVYCQHKDVTLNVTFIMKKLMLFLLVVVVWACKETAQTTPVVPVAAVDERMKEVQDLLKKFADEGKARGVSVNTSVVRFQFDDLTKEGHWGYCYAAQDANFNFIIDPSKTNLIKFDSSAWRRMSSVEREWLLFHECGHCALGRKHENRTFSNGESYSIMSAGDAGVYGGQVNYSGFRRNFYLDELFNPRTPSPSWADSQPLYSSVSSSQKKVVFKETFDKITNDWVANQNRTATVEDGVISLKGTSNNDLISLNAPISVDYTQNFEIEFDIKIATRENYGQFVFGENQRPNNFTVDLFPEKAISYLFLPPFNLIRLSTDSGSNVKNNEFNKITIRRIGDRYHYYINEKPAYFFDYFRPNTNKPLWIFSSGNGSTQYDNFVYSVIN